MFLVDSCSTLLTLLQVIKCKYNIVRNGDTKHLCDDTCFKVFRATPTKFLQTGGDNPAPSTVHPPPAPTRSSSVPAISTRSTPSAAKAQLAPKIESCLLCSSVIPPSLSDKFTIELGQGKPWKRFCQQVRRIFHCFFRLQFQFPRN